MLSDDKFSDKAKGFCLVKNTENECFTIEEYKEKISALQTDKDGKTVCLYTNNAEEQFSFVMTNENCSSALLVYRQTVFPSLSV